MLSPIRFGNAYQIKFHRNPDSKQISGMNTEEEHAWVAGQLAGQLWFSTSGRQDFASFTSEGTTLLLDNQRETGSSLTVDSLNKAIFDARNALFQKISEKPFEIFPQKEFDAIPAQVQK